MKGLVPFEIEMAATEIFGDNFAQVFLRKDDIIQVQIANNFDIDEEDTEMILDIIKDLSKDRKLAVLVIYEQFNTFTEEAMQLVANHDFTLADAFVINDSFVLTAFANYYLHYTKPKRPTKIFDNPSDAILWLKTIQTPIQ
jgi:nitrogen regulatory protein PII-like uncharacterized protein